MPMRHALRELTRSGLRAVYELFRSALFWSRLATRVRTHFERALAAPSSGEPAKESYKASGPPRALGAAAARPSGAALAFGTDAILRRGKGVKVQTTVLRSL
jgi:hypothetical protein